MIQAADAGVGIEGKVRENDQETGKICLLYKMARCMKFFSMLCSITGVKKIVLYNEYSFIPRFCCRAEDRTITTYAFTSQPQLPINREITEKSLSKCGLESCAARPHKMWRLASHAGRVG